jgi:riboflavin kinase/FMN adenylyltransferase
MRIFRNKDEFDIEKTAVALGNFDGLHIAHKRIIERSVEYGRTHGCAGGVLLFDRHTRTSDVPLIMTIEQKLEILERMGVDFVYIQSFNDEFRRRSTVEFAEFLKDALRAGAVCVGYDYRFGYRACGGVAELNGLGERFGFDVEVVPPVMLDGEIVGSTGIRALISDGNMEKAARFLGRYFFLEGVVSYGLKNGTKMGFPTANILARDDMALPSFGVYTGYVQVRGKRFHAVINVGKNPTFNAREITIESHLLDFDEDIYGEQIRVEFVRKTRGIYKFESIDQLKERIALDVKEAERLL